MARIDLNVPFAEKDDAKRLGAPWDQLFCEPVGAFCPVDERTASRIVLHAVEEPFGANANVSYGDHFFEDMREA